MNKAIIISIIIAIAIGIAISSALIYNEDNNMNDNAINTDSTHESEPKQFSVELHEGLGVSEEP